MMIMMVMITMMMSLQAESAKMKGTLDNGNAAAQKMSTHGEADKTYAENIKRWDVVDKCIKDWIVKMEALIKMWTDQAGEWLIMNDDSLDPGQIKWMILLMQTETDLIFQN